MDIMMPVMNGIEAARNIRRKEKNGGKEIPIIANDRTVGKRK